MAYGAHFVGKFNGRLTQGGKKLQRLLKKLKTITLLEYNFITQAEEVSSTTQFSEAHTYK